MFSKIKLVGEPISIKLEAIKEMVDFEWPDSYLDFLEQYGYGVVTSNIEYLNIMEPDKDFFKNNFLKYIDLWEWKEEAQKNKIFNSILVAHTFDGQHVYYTESSFLLLPKFDTPIEFPNFESVVQYFVEFYNMNGVKYICACV